MLTSYSKQAESLASHESSATNLQLGAGVFKRRCDDLRTLKPLHQAEPSLTHSETGTHNCLETLGSVYICLGGSAVS